MDILSLKQTTGIFYDVISTFPKELASLTASYVEHKDLDAFGRIHKSYEVKGEFMCSNASLNEYYIEISRKIQTEGVEYLHSKEKEQKADALVMPQWKIHMLSNDELRSLRYLLSITRVPYKNKEGCVQTLAKELDHETMTMKEWKKKRG